MDPISEVPFSSEFVHKKVPKRPPQAGFAMNVHCFGVLNMDVSKNRGTPKWMVYNGNLC